MQKLTINILSQKTDALLAKNNARGFSLAEVLVAITILMIAIVPAMNALTEGVLAAGIHRDEASAARSAQNKMEEILARSFTNLANAVDANANSATIALPALATPPASAMDDSGYSDSKHDVFIYFCKNSASTLVYASGKTNLLCIKIAQKNSGTVLLQSVKAS